jgi:hypothetical protein
MAPASVIRRPTGGPVGAALLAGLVGPVLIGGLVAWAGPGPVVVAPAGPVVALARVHPADDTDTGGTDTGGGDVQFPDGTTQTDPYTDWYGDVYKDKQSWIDGVDPYTPVPAAPEEPSGDE